VQKPVFSQIIRLIILPDAAQRPVDWTVGLDWEAVTDNASNTVAFGRILYGKGGIAEPVEASLNLGKINRQITRRRYTLDFEMTASEQNRALFRHMQAGGLDFRFWFFTAGSWLFGGASGIKPLVVSAVTAFLPGGNDFELGRIRLEFAADSDPVGAYVPDFAEVGLYSGFLIDDDGDYLIDTNTDYLET
jgi:hypothetical protein